MASTGAITLLLFSQPCPAPVFAAIGAAASAVQAGVAVADAVEDKRDLGARGGEKGSGKGGDGTWDNFNECVDQIMYGNQVSTSSRAGYMEISNCPQVCGSFVEEYNASPNIQELNAQYGEVIWADGTLTYTAAGGSGSGGWGDKQGWKRGEKKDDKDWSDKGHVEPPKEEPKEHDWSDKKDPPKEEPKHDGWSDKKEPPKEEPKHDGWTDKKEPPKEEPKHDSWTDKGGKGDHEQHKGGDKHSKRWAGWTPRGGSRF